MQVLGLTGESVRLQCESCGAHAQLERLAYQARPHRRLRCPTCGVGTPIPSTTPALPSGDFGRAGERELAALNA